MLVIVCPGQGSQVPGFLAPWLEVPGFADRMTWLSAVAGIDLLAHGTTSDADTIRDTAIAQPLIVASGLVSMLSLFEHPSDGYPLVGAGAGHSVGEITAAAAAGIISAEAAMTFVRERGRAMAAASSAAPTGMSAVVGGDAAEVEAAIASYRLTPANINGAGQVVAAGLLSDLAELAANPPARARVIPLQVAGAFHTHHMAPATATLERYEPAMTTKQPRTRIVSCADGQVVQSGREFLRRMVRQVELPVRWDLVMQTFADLGVTGLIEVPPAGTLTNLAKRALPGVETLAVKTPDDLDAARRMVAEHGEPMPASMSGHPTWSMLVSPAKGTVARGDAVAGDPIAVGDELAVVTTLRDAHRITASHPGTLTEWLVEHGDPVAPGQPLVRLYPVEEQAR